MKKLFKKYGYILITALAAAAAAAVLLIGSRFTGTDGNDIPVVSHTNADSTSQAAENTASTAQSTSYTVSGDSTPDTSNAPQSADNVSDKRQYCTFSIDCSRAAGGAPDNISALIPDDGMIFYGENVTVNDGDSVTDVLRRVCEGYSLALEISGGGTAAYVEGIGGIYEFDCGVTSGWIYRVNGMMPPYGAGQCTVHGGDVIEFIYTLDLGNDIE